MVSISADSDETPVIILAASGKEASEKIWNVVAARNICCNASKTETYYRKSPCLREGDCEGSGLEPAARLRFAAVR